MVNNDSSFVQGTLDFGMKLSKSFFIILFSCFFVILLTCAIPLIVILSTSTNLGLDNTEIICLLLFLIVSFIADVILLIVYFRQKLFFKYKITEYLNDPLIYGAKAFILENGHRGFGVYATFNISAEFILKGEKKLVKGKKFCKRFKPYIGKDISILYSPKFDQVMILKDQ